MQTQLAKRHKQRMDMPVKGGLGRAIKYLGHYKRLTALAYSFLFISTAAQLAVPQLVQNIIDAVTNGVIASASMSATTT